ncbi:hypothetical protein [Desulfovibrio sp.]|uniref:hypothetical protein n=1 Tax=Desulfovibrio sp. TaxID=885 RepID=UPI0025B8F52E|nr:hypothetical protein [Desulfovibrio sp.]
MPIRDTLLARLAEAEERIRQLESDNRKLRRMLLAHEQDLESLEPGHYVVTSDGWNGPYHNQKQALELGKDFAQEDFSFTVEIVARHEAQEQPDDNAGLYTPWTMNPPARVAA